MKKDKTNFILILIFLAGLSLMLYPSFSDYWNSFRQSRAISLYTQEIANIDNISYDHIWYAAKEHNEALKNLDNPYLLSDELRKDYEECLNISGSGVMGYIDIPLIDVTLPIYHGTSDAVLQVAIGHMEWSSLPVGGEGTHCVVSGHRGLPSAKLFTDIDQLIVGDTFLLYILDEVLTYEVDQIRIVEPHEVQDLVIEEGHDLCTLVTCNPYGINSHRLLVRGHRIANAEAAKVLRVTADAVLIEPYVAAPIMALPMLAVLLLYLMISTRKKK